ncbi:hypothetical protein [Tautonia plasticadhaerens]|uniref:Uncharacterized protein n=1 Tax=Tautonia plasticadhaerens TaxID=2527974 RepID=A0A518H9H5_9BACT|nr:hypothetical protein [Tautonia plasticadhaerens]QDV37512.1 hypothetical protein ElP_54520 [Tautonia plasticadhaerens]
MDARILLSALAFASSAVLGSPSWARVTPSDRMPDSAETVFAPGPEGPSMTAEQKASAEQEAQQRKQQRLQKIQQLTFDRRPSSILKAWATPEGEQAETPTDAPPGGVETSPGAGADPAVSTPNAPRISGATTMTVIRASGGIVVSSRATTLPTQGGVEVVEGILTDSGNAAVEPTVTDTVAGSTADDDGFDGQLKSFQRDVTLGDWEDCGTILAELPEDEAKALYTRLVQTLPNPPMPGAEQAASPEMVSGMVMTVQQPTNPQFMEQNVVSNEDVIAIAGMAPVELDAPLLSALGRLLAASLQQGHAVEDFADRVRAQLGAPEQDRAVSGRQAAKLLMGAGRAIEAGEFLPSIEQAEADDDREALNLLSRHHLAQHAKDRKAGHLERAWAVTQAVLAVGDVEASEKDEALTRAVELAPKVAEEFGLAWLEESFVERPDRGMEIIAAIGKAAAQGLQARPFDTDFRLKALELQRTAVDALLAAAPDRADSWAESLQLLALAWLAEAEHSRQFDTSSSLGPRMTRDMYGNIFFSQPGDEDMQMQMMAQNNNMPRPLQVADVLKARPGGPWLDRVDPALTPRFAAVNAQLYLKVGEESEAFPFIEQIAGSHPEQAKGLAEEFLRIWTRNHDPNAARSYTNPYIFMYGFERRAESIPLTRSKQERNLRELAGWIRRLESLPIEGIDERLLANAFTTSHSKAEVYRLEDIEDVFGPVDGLEPKTMALLIQQMRDNLNGIWRLPATQEDSKTRRRERDIRAEVLRGYEVARAVVDRGLNQWPGHHALIQAGAAVEHDLNNYLQELEPTPSFAPKRLEALDRFREAAAAYAEVAPGLSEDEQSVDVYQQWFAAGLGACDLGNIKPEHQGDPKQPPKIREAIESLPGDASKRHMDMFANSIFTRLSTVGPELKGRYLDAAFAIVGDHPQAAEARKVHEYYKDLITEIDLDTRVDGPTDIGSGSPFGLFVDLRHTIEIERESGGFGRYLQNQNTGIASYYNYGRPLENYRDKFEEAVRRALEEHFVVHSITFQPEDVHSRATERPGWRVTPYAYVLLEARGPEVDSVPPLRLDLDFLDTSGYVVLPVESASLRVDASTDAGPRPFDGLQVTQTLDERQAEQGRLILEVKAVARGLVPELEELLELDSPGLSVAEVEDQGLSVARFDPEADDVVVVSERTWVVDLHADDAEAGPPAEFHFASVEVDPAEVTYQRYDDADLAEVEPVIALERDYGDRDLGWLWVSLGAAAVVVVAVLAVAFRPREADQVPEAYRIPEPLTPFTVLGLLRDIERHDGFPGPQHDELAATIDRLETYYFVTPAGEEPDLRGIAEDWVRRSA